MMRLFKVTCLVLLGIVISVQAVDKTVKSKEEPKEKSRDKKTVITPAKREPSAAPARQARAPEGRPGVTAKPEETEKGKKKHVAGAPEEEVKLEIAEEPEKEKEGPARKGVTGERKEKGEPAKTGPQKAAPKTKK